MAAAIYEADGILGAVCHGPAALVNIQLSDGEYLVANKTVAAFTNEEEAAVGLTDIVPFLLESKLIEPGDHFTKVANFQAHGCCGRSACDRPKPGFSSRCRRTNGIIDAKS
jgi:putative intracellular protease/amidase